MYESKTMEEALFDSNDDPAQWVLYHHTNKSPTPRGELVYFHDKCLPPVVDTAEALQTSSVNWPCVPEDGSHQGTFTDSSFDMDQFFDFDSAALDQTSVISPQKGDNSPSETSPPDMTTSPGSYTSPGCDSINSTAAISGLTTQSEVTGLSDRHSDNQPKVGVASLPVLPKNRKRNAPEEDIPGYSCFNWITPNNHGTSLRKQPRTKTKEQQEESTKIRQQGACLRCYVQKLKCSSSYPCEACKSVFERAHGSKTLQWTACIVSYLPDMNIFTYRMTIQDDGRIPVNSSNPKTDQPFGNVSMALFEVIMHIGSEGGSNSLFASFDTYYQEIIQYVYGVTDVHNFVLQDRHPLNVLLQLNTILAGASILNMKLVGYIRYMRKLRGICAALTFQALDKALDRNRLAAASLERQIALIVNIALMLEQVLNLGDQNPAAPSSPGDTVYNDMQNHLTQYLFHYLRRLTSNVFNKKSKILQCISNTSKGVKLHESFWAKLSQATGNQHLTKPPKIHNHSDPEWEEPEIMANLYRLNPLGKPNSPAPTSNLGSMSGFLSGFAHPMLISPSGRAALGTTPFECVDSRRFQNLSNSLLIPQTKGWTQHSSFCAF